MNIDKSITLLVFIASSLASLSLIPQLALVNVNTSNYGFLYALDVNYYSYGFAVSATTNTVVSFGTTYGALSGYCGTNEDATAWIFTLSGEPVALRFLCASTYGYERIYSSHVKDNYIYIAGSMRWLPGSQYDVNYEALIAKLDPNGNLVWGKALGNLSTSEEFYGVTVDDHIYAVGYTSTDVEAINPLPRGILVVKIDKSSGNTMWAYTYNSTIYHTITGLETTSTSGSIYVLGRAVTYEGYEKNVVVKINANGDVMWALETSSRYEDIVAGDGVYLVGSVVTKLDPNGNLVWSKRYGAHFLSAYYYNGYVYLSGFMDNKPLTARIDKNGNVVWAKQLDYDGWAHGVAVYGDMVYVTGYISLTYTAQFILGITEDFTNDHVIQVQLEPAQETETTAKISLNKYEWNNYEQTASMRSGEMAFWSPAPIFKGSGVSAPISVPPTEESPPPETKYAVVIAVVFCSLLALSRIRAPIKREYLY